MTTTQLSVCYLEVERLTNVFRRISVPFRETSHIVILGVWARTNFRKIRWRSSLLGASSSTPPCPAGKLCPWVSKPVDGRCHNHKREREGCEKFKKWLKCRKSGGASVESLRKSFKFEAFCFLRATSRQLSQASGFWKVLKSVVDLHISIVHL